MCCFYRKIDTKRTFNLIKFLKKKQVDDIQLAFFVLLESGDNQCHYWLFG